MTTAPLAGPRPGAASIEIRVRGRVQSVGFRPFVWRQARALGLAGYVLNDGEGVLIRAAGQAASLDELVRVIRDAPPPMAHVASIEANSWTGALPGTFEIRESGGGGIETEVAPDAVMCADCARDIRNPTSRRYRYPFTTCTNCGPRLTIVARMPYDRATTSMAPFPLCPECAAEYTDPADRRFHAETTACPACGPRLRLERLDGSPAFWDRDTFRDEVEAAAVLIADGAIVAVKGLGGYHLACDAASTGTVARLRAAKHRDRKPFAMMARDINVVRRYARVSAAEQALLESPAGPIVLLDRHPGFDLPEAIAPGLALLGFMLPTTPLHALLIDGFDRPLVMTSGNISERPQVIADADARRELATIADYALVHDRDILNRVDDSVVRMADGDPRLLRRARGYAPAPVRLPAGFEAAPPVLAIGGDLKNAFCILQRGSAVLSQHIGDLDDIDTAAGLERAIALYRDMLDARPALAAADLHPNYRSTAIAMRLADQAGVPVARVQHHHAHIAACLAENGWPLDGPRVLGLALDGLGYGTDGTIWGGEILLADYRRFERVGSLRAVAMPGGDKASLEPWRNLYAQLASAIGWPEVSAQYGHLGPIRALAAKPLGLLDAMMRNGVNVPLTSSAGRLFDAVAAAAGLCFDRQGYEGEAASLLESAVDRAALAAEPGYPFTLRDGTVIAIDPAPMWKALLADLAAGVPVSVIAARFHAGLAAAFAGATMLLRGSHGFDAVALSGGCFNNRILLEELSQRLTAAGFRVLSHTEVPAGDGGLALGQAAIAAALSIRS